jgi:hypothetical protein
MKPTWKHWRHRFFQRGPQVRRLPKTTRMGFDPQYRRGAFSKPKFGRYDITFRWKLWLGRIAMAGLACLALWIVWQSWHGMHVFDN